MSKETVCTCREHKSERLTLNAVLRLDPTRTTTLRNRFAADATRRFRALMRDITETIVENDAFGLTDTAPRRRRAASLMEAAPPRAFAFPRSSEKIAAFMEWLQEQYELPGGVLDKTQGGRLFIRTDIASRLSVEEAWTNVYVQSAYQKGIINGRNKLRAAGVDIPQFGEGALIDESVVAMFNQPFHVDRIGALFTRTFSDLKGITQAMDASISRTLAQGLLEGRGPADIARLINDRVEAIGIARARTLARTEVIRAHHVATITEYEAAGVTGVTVQAEWATAGFGVCSICQDLEGRVFGLQEMLGMIPIHPN